MPITLEPLGANVLIALEPEPEQSKVITVVKQYSDTVRSGRVTGVGPEVTRVARGARVWCSTLAGTELNLDPSAPTLLLPETSIMAVLDGPG